LQVEGEELLDKPQVVKEAYVDYDDPMTGVKK
jgi:hypothetical protein